MRPPCYSPQRIHSCPTFLQAMAFLPSEFPTYTVPTLSLSSTPTQSTTPVARASTPHPITGAYMNATSQDIGVPHTLSRKRSFQVEIESNGSTHTGREQEIPSNVDYPIHFETLPIQPTPTINSIPYLSRPDLHLRTTILRVNALNMTHAPTTPCGKEEQIMFGDTVILNNTHNTVYTVIGLHSRCPTDYVIYIIEEQVHRFTMMMYTLKIWSVEANRKRM